MCRCRAFTSSANHSAKIINARHAASVEVCHARRASFSVRDPPPSPRLLPLKGYADQPSYHAKPSRSAAYLLLPPESRSSVLARDNYVYRFLSEL
jgi:hypothetical protein